MVLQIPVFLSSVSPSFLAFCVISYRENDRRFSEAMRRRSVGVVRLCIYGRCGHRTWNSGWDTQPVNGDSAIEGTVSSMGANNGDIRVAGGTLTVPATLAVSDYFIQVSAAGSTFDPSTSLTIVPGGGLLVDKPHSLSGNLTIQSGGTLSHWVNDNPPTYGVDLTIGRDLTVEAGGEVNVDRKGYPKNTGPGKEGSHGGRGSRGSAGSPYGWITEPMTHGSGGGVIFSNNCTHYTTLPNDKTFGYFEMKNPSFLSLSGSGTLYTSAGLYTTNDWNGYATPPNISGDGTILIEPAGSVLFLR